MPYIYIYIYNTNYKTIQEKKMKIQCDVCEKKEAKVYCGADEAALCEGCDYKVHHANKLATKHLRSSLLLPSFTDSPLCDVCQEKRAFLFCKEDRAILCRECDIQIHKANEHTQNHHRFLLTGVKISSSTETYPASSSSCSSEPNYPNSSIHTKSSSVSTSSNYDHDQMFNQNYYYSNINNIIPSSLSNHNQDNCMSNTISEYPIETSISGWKLEDLLDSSSASNNFFKSSEFNTNQQMEESMGGFGSEYEWGFHHQLRHEGPLVPSHLHC